jgi:hypothetical protein
MHKHIIFNLDTWRRKKLSNLPGLGEWLTLNLFPKIANVAIAHKVPKIY